MVVVDLRLDCYVYRSSLSYESWFLENEAAAAVVVETVEGKLLLVARGVRDRLARDRTGENVTSTIVVWGSIEFALKDIDPVEEGVGVGNHGFDYNLLAYSCEGS